jgi:hypothetical protein
LCGPASAQESIVKAEELIRLQDIPLSRPAPFETMHPPEQLEYLAWLALRATDTSTSWNPRNRAWTLYRANIRYSLEQSLRQRWQSSAGAIRSLAQNPDTALARFYADGLSGAELDEALAFFRGEAGKKYLAYLRELKRAYYSGLLELDRIGIDPAYGAPGDSVAERRKAWLAKNSVSLEPPPLGYGFHARSAAAVFPSAKADTLVFALIAGAPPGTEAFRRLDARLSAEDRGAVTRFVKSGAAEKEKKARAAWNAAILKSRDVLPVALNDVRSIVDVVAQWRKVRADPRALPRSIVQVDPASIEIPQAYATVALADAGLAAAMKACIPGVSEHAIRTFAEPSASVGRVVYLPESRNLFVSRQGSGVCIPTTIPGYPVPALNSFVGTLRVVGLDDGATLAWHRAVAQEVAANGASESLIVLPNGNAYEITYAVNVRSPHSLIYSWRLLLAGTYEPKSYRTVQPAPEFRALQSIGTVAATGAADVVRHEKSLFSTPADLQREDERRAKDLKPGG